METIRHICARACAPLIVAAFFVEADRFIDLQMLQVPVFLLLGIALVGALLPVRLQRRTR